MQRKKVRSAIRRQRGIKILRDAMYGRGILGVFEDVISKGDKKEGRLWVSYAKIFFVRNVPEEIKNKYKNERMEFEKRIRRLMGDGADQFWLEAFRYHQLLFDKRAKEIPNEARKSKYEYKDLEEIYNRAIKALKTLYRKGFIIYPYPFFITRPPLNYPRWITKRKPLNLFIYCMGVTLRAYMTPTQSYRVIQDFLSYYSGEYLEDLDTIKKIVQRDPFHSKG